MTTPTNTVAPEAPAKRKPDRSKKIQPQAEATPVDFKALAAETRAKLAGGKNLLAEIQPAPIEWPAVGSQVSAQPQTTPILEGSKVISALLTSLRASPLNPRKHFELDSIAKLAESILHKGLMQNLVVRLGNQPNTTR